LGILKSFKGGRKNNPRFPIRKRVALAIHLWDQERSCESRLLAGGARIHIDFHADRHFYDLWCLPGHLALLVVKNRTVSALSVKLIRNLNFASKIFASYGNEAFMLRCNKMRRGRHQTDAGSTGFFASAIFLRWPAAKMASSE
jgi:hypothetical protein